MSDIKFTPGPWSKANTADIFTGLGAINAEDTTAASNDGWHIADCDMGGLCLEEVRANAYLIAAAPELYEMLDRVWHECSDDISGFAQMEIEKVLKKARGES